MSLLESWRKQDWTDGSLRIEHGSMRGPNDSALHLRWQLWSAQETLLRAERTGILTGSFCPGGFAATAVDGKEGSRADGLWLTVFNILWLSEKDFRSPGFWLVSQEPMLREGRLTQVRRGKAGNPMNGKNFPGLALTPIFWLFYGAFPEVSHASHPQAILQG